MRQKSTMGNKAPCPSAILMAMRMRWSKACGIARCSKTGATLDAPGSRHQAATRSVLPRQLPGQQSSKQQSNNTPTLLGVLMAIVMQRYNTAHIARWRRFRASPQATGCCHPTSTCSNNINWSYLPLFCWCFSIVNSLKTGAKQKDGPRNNRGMIYPTKGKHLSKTTGYLVGGGG